MCWRVLEDASPDVSSACRSLGQFEISEEMKAALEEFALEEFALDFITRINRLM